MIRTSPSTLFSLILYRIIIPDPSFTFNPSLVKAVNNLNKLLNELLIRNRDIIYYIILHCVFEAFVVY